MPRQSPYNPLHLRYVLYARKSTEDDTRQVRSIDDQIKDCIKLAKQRGLNVVAVLKESKSAKKPGQRPVFAKMFSDIEAGVYDAILCWHPDRLSRNMLEGGAIINSLDEGVLKDICFHSHQFSNDANGKMLLGMLFVFSKQYSDDLSDKVNRGVQGNLSEGRSAGTPKWGYTRSEVTGLYESNEFLSVVREAWRMRVDGESLDTITAYMNAKNVHRVTKNLQKQRAVRMTKSTLGNMFHDPFYYGVLLQSGQSVDLRELIPGFESAIEKEVYDLVQTIGYGRTRSLPDKERVVFYPLHGFVFCAVCGSDHHMLVGKNKTGSGKYVLSYRCNNKLCTRSPRSLRAKHIFNSLYETLGRLELSDEAYARYSTELDGQTEEKIVAVRQDIFSKRGALTHIVKEINERALSVGRLLESSPAYVPNMDALEQLTTQRVALEADIKKLEEKVADPHKVKLTKDEFLNLVKTAADKMRAGSAVEKDVLCRILFLNLRVDNEKVAVYHWREPFATLVKATSFQVGGGGWS
ncbi:MAG TPA: recombinase family protein [Candidatus Saccharimonadales bacterium]|nr:recombinase family protein [Candidatus Saccharimonadales bacterium]